MVGLIVVSTISPHDHHGLLRPTLLMGDIPVATARSGHHLDNSISAALLPKAAGIDEASSFNPRLSISPQDSSRHLIKQQSQQWGRRPRRHGSSPLLTRSAAPYGTSTDAPNTGGPSRAPTAALDTSSVVFTPTDDPNGTCTPAYGSQHSHIGTRRCESGALAGSDSALEACTMTIVASVPLCAVLAASSAVSIASKVAVSSVVAAVGLCTDDDAMCG